jgi:hypothetical protein
MIIRVAVEDISISVEMATDEVLAVTGIFTPVSIAAEIVKALKSDDVEGGE